MRTDLQKSRFAEFFAGGGMVSAALRDRWECVFANDMDAMKCAAYRDNWGGDVLVEGDVADVPVSALRQPVDLCWGSPPCQDFSLAGKGAGLRGARSSVFTVWRDLLSDVCESGYAPSIIAFENVTGIATRRGGADLIAVVESLARLGYRVGAFFLDAKDFLPQSRPRVFVVAVRDDLAIPPNLLAVGGRSGDGDALAPYRRSFSSGIAERLISWSLPDRSVPMHSLSDVIDATPDTKPLAPSELARLLSLMSERHLETLEAIRAGGGVRAMTIYKRGRPDGAGGIAQRAELRVDGIAGCLRTPSGGSSRQTILISDDGDLTARLLSSREIMRLMGLADDYRVPPRYNDAYRIAGDGVAVPVVRYLAESLFDPLLRGSRARQAA